ncbi:hypothetical protein [Prosthecobacter dejongeii]|uniref:TIGR03016 family PEP-CTERM system-associated outer membrane protein n=1 Tax=Prosthecobacter dejongeii TaxID=48465 RepID=A0A7W7YGR4_9BACT|nr:hypothetical protein [Prosthecobacter dejongeii]MBB5035921.1 hypothetical protein [Prosthecobacter dejongeii]
MAMHHNLLSHVSGRLLRNAGIACSIAAALSFSSSLAADPTLPTEVDQSAGYFPTIAEDTLLRGANDSRSLGIGFGPDQVEGPDTRGLVATDLFRYYDNSPDFYQRNQDFFRPINKTLGVFTHHDAFTAETNQLSQASFTVDGSFNILTREFNPELAHIKAGPLYFDVLWAGAGLIYSDFNGELPGTENEDGFAAFVEVGVRGLVRLSDSIYLSVVANLIYLPLENELAFRLGNAANPGLLLRFNLSEQWGEWEVLFFNEFVGRSGLDIFVDADSPAEDRSGRYSFGFLSDRQNDFYSSDLAFFTNTVGFWASRPVFENQWRLGFGIEHADFWTSFSFDDHGTRDNLRLWMQYEGSIIPFAPRFSYEYISNDGYRSLIHLLEMQLTGRLTENVNWLGSAGYAFRTGDTPEANDFIWRFELDHTITRSTRHMLSLGEGYQYNEFQSDTRTSRYVRYAVDQRITSKFNVDAFVQYAENEASVNDRFPVRDRFGAGMNLSYYPLDFTAIRALAMYEQSDQSSTSDDSARWLYRVEVNQQLSHRLTGNVFYQYEEMNSDVSPFTEHFFGVSMRRYF